MRRQVGRLRYLVRILRLGQFGHETGVLPVEVDEDERAEDHDANEAVSSERGSCPCFGKENIFSRTSSSIIPFYLRNTRYASLMNNNLFKSNRYRISFSFFLSSATKRVQSESSSP